MVLKSTRSDGQAAKEERNDRFAQSRLRRQIVFICMIVAGVMISQIAQRELIVRSSYQLVSVKNQVNNLQKENEFLKIELAGLSSPDRIQQIATKELGMVVPEKVHYVQTASTEKTTKETALLP
jgi:cell division protein FtsL